MYKRYEHSKTNDKADTHINNSQIRKGDITGNCVSPCIHTHLSPQKEVTIPVSAIIISLFSHEFLPSTPASLYKIVFSFAWFWTLCKWHDTVYILISIAKPYFERLIHADVHHHSSLSFNAG